MARALSRYQQLRMTVTEEAGGWVTIRVLAKPVDADWTLRNTVYHHRMRLTERTRHWTTLLSLAADEVARGTFPD